MYLPKKQTKTQWYIGLDLGQRRDYSALACLEISWQKCAPNLQPVLALLGLDRFPLGIDYEEIPRLLARRLDQIDATPGSYASPIPPKHLIIDGGGPGPPVIDRIRRKMANRVNLRPVMITSGRGQNTLSGGYTGVPRRTLVSDVLLLLSNGTLQFAQGLDHSEILEEEFANLSAGNSQPASARAHDDLVIAVALGVWGALVDAPELLPDHPIPRQVIWDPAGYSAVPPPQINPLLTSTPADSELLKPLAPASTQMSRRVQLTRCFIPTYISNRRDKMKKDGGIT